MSPKGKLGFELFDQLSQKLDQGIKKSKDQFHMLNASVKQATSATKESYEKLANENQKLHSDYEKQVKKIQKEIKDSETSALTQKIELLNQLHQEYLTIIDQVRLAPLQELQTLKLKSLFSQLEEFTLGTLEDTVESLAVPMYDLLNRHLKEVTAQVQQADGVFEDFLNQGIWFGEALDESLQKLERIMIESIEQFKTLILATFSQVAKSQDIEALLKKLTLDTEKSKTYQSQKESELNALESSLNDDLTTHQQALADLRKEAYQRLFEPLQSKIESESQEVTRLQAQLKELQVRVTEATQPSVQKSLLKRYDRMLKVYRKTHTGKLERTVDKQLKKSVSDYKVYVSKRHQRYAEERINPLSTQVQDNLQSRINIYRTSLSTHQQNNKETMTILNTIHSLIETYAKELYPLFSNVYTLEVSLKNAVHSYASVKQSLKEKFLSDVQTTVLLLRKELALKSSLLLKQTLQSELTYSQFSHQLEIEMSKIKHHNKLLHETQAALAHQAANFKSNLEQRFQAKATILRFENYLNRMEKEQQVHQQKLEMIHAFESNLIKAKALRFKSDYRQQNESLELEIVRQIELLESQMELSQAEHASRIQTIEEDHQQEIGLINENIQQLEQTYLDKLNKLATVAAKEKQALEIAMHHTSDKKTLKKLRKQAEKVTLNLKANSKSISQDMATDYDLTLYRDKLNLVKGERDVQLKDAHQYYLQESEMLSSLLNEAKDKLNHLTKPSSTQQNIEKLESNNSDLLDQRLHTQLITSHQQWEKMIKIPQEKLDKATQDYEKLLESAHKSNPDLSNIKQNLEPEYEGSKQALKQAYEKELKLNHKALVKHQTSHQLLLAEFDKIQFTSMPSIKAHVPKEKNALAPESVAFQKRLTTFLETEKQAITQHITAFEKTNFQASELLKSLDKNQAKWLHSSLKNI